MVNKIISVRIPTQFYLPTFSESYAWDFYLVTTGISKMYRPLPKICERYPEDVPTTFEHFQSYLKGDNISIMWYS